MPPRRKQPSGAANRKIKALKQELEQAKASAPSAPPIDEEGIAVFAAKKTEFEELPVYGVPGPKLVGAVEAILTALETGNFHSAAPMFDAMMRDDRVYGVTSVRLNGLFGLPLDLEPALDTKRARAIKEDAEDKFSRIFPLSQVAELQRWGLFLGAGVGQILWDRDGKEWIPYLKVWHARFLRWDWAARKYKLITVQGEIAIEPDDPQWIIYEPYGPRGWLRGLLRSLALPWLIRAWVRNWWARYAEVHGSPIRAGVIPQERNPADEKKFLSQLSAIGSEAVLRLPQGMEGNRFDLKLIEAVGRSTETFQALLSHCDDSIAITVLGQRQSTMGQGGLGSQENAGDSVRLDLKRGDALIGDCLRENILCQWADANYGFPDLAPYIRWKVDPPEDMHKKGQQLQTLAAAIQTFVVSGAPVDVRALLESFNIPLLDEDEMPPDVPGTPDPRPKEKDEGAEQEPAEGDEEPDLEDPAEDAENEPEPETEKLIALSAKLGHLTQAAKQGDAYAMALAASAKRLAAKALGPDLSRVKQAIEASTSIEDLKSRLKSAFKGMDPDKLGELIHKTLIMAKLSGMWSASRDTSRR